MELHASLFEGLNAFFLDFWLLMKKGSEIENKMDELQKMKLEVQRVL